MSFWQGKRVLVTGGCGFIGSFLVRSLVERGAKVRIADNLERGTIESLGAITDKVEMQKVDLREPGVARRACEGMDVVFHMASKVGGIGYYLKYPWDVLHSNLTMDGNVLAAIIEPECPTTSTRRAPTSTRLNSSRISRRRRSGRIKRIRQTRA